MQERLRGELTLQASSIAPISAVRMTGCSRRPYDHREVSLLNLKGLNKTYPPTGEQRRDAPIAPALRDVSIKIERGEFFTLLGPSGCGKTTTLQCIAGLEHPSAGRIELDGQVAFCSKEKILLPPNKRGLGMVFQSYAIWPHMTVYENVAFPLQHGPAKVPGSQVRAKVMTALERVKLEDFAERPTPYLSGGQQQRVALARSLVSEPSIMLLDEPLSNLDAKLRDSMRVELRDLVKSLGITTIYVTHDQVEALSMSDRIALMNKGQIEQLGTPEDLYMRPISAFAAEFIGRSNIIVGSVAAGGADGVVKMPFGDIGCVMPSSASVGDRLEVMIRPHGVQLNTERKAPEGENTFQGTITHLSFVGEFMDLTIALIGAEINVFATPYGTYEVGQTVNVTLPKERCVAMAPRA